MKISKKQEYKRIYTENLKKLIASTEDNARIINFNYTSILQDEPVPYKNIKEMNVHGRYDKVTIFGIDQSECNIDTDEFIFSKTYRKISENTMSMSLPYKKDARMEYQELIFYGHSLASADYSYFQSLFDLYDIYNQTRVTFKYSIYDPTKSYEIKKEVFHNVTSLIVNYGKTMSNKDHGKNLLHKILLEGRLKLEEITLDDMNYK